VAAEFIPESIKRARWNAQFASRKLLLYRLLYRRYRQFTMTGERRFVANLDICTRHVPNSGCIIECGVWRGGMSAAIADALPSRVHFLFDSFEGLPPAQYVDGDRAAAFQRDKDSPVYYDNCSAERAFAERCMSMSKAKEFHLIPGWFSATIPAFQPPEPIALLRLDGDWYDSTMQCLTGLYRHLMPGGVVIIDDYYDWEGCTRAVHDFLSSGKLIARLRQSGTVCYFAKPSEEETKRYGCSSHR